MTAGHLSNIERGRRRVDRRSTLEALAAALRVAPAELAVTPFPPRDDLSAEARAVAGSVEAAVSGIRLDDPVSTTPRPWAEIAADLYRLNTELRPRADYAAQGPLLPNLIAELHAVYVVDKTHRTAALGGLAMCYHAAAMLAQSMGTRGVVQLAAERQCTAAERLGRPEWTAHTAWVRAQMIGSIGREQQARLANRSIADLEHEPMTSELIQAVGQLHLTAALAYATMGQEDNTWTHFHEAETLAVSQAEEVGTFGYMWFGRANVRMWKVALGAELGYGGKVAEMARQARPELLPSPARQGEFYADFGRTLARDKRTRLEAIQVLRKAEDLAPQRIRNMPFVREAVIDLLNKSQHDAVGCELRGWPIGWRSPPNLNGSWLQRESGRCSLS